jgi:hypothetical protein
VGLLGWEVFAFRDDVIILYKYSPCTQQRTPPVLLRPPPPNGSLIRFGFGGSGVGVRVGVGVGVWMKEVV